MLSQAKVLYQVKLILDYLPEEEYKLIPQEMIDYIEDNFEYDENFSIDPEIPLEKQKIDDKAFKLNVYQNVDLNKKTGYEDYLFLPFSDLTCGKESYIGGRYVDMKIQKGKTWTIDFNKAYNPYCAYNYEYSCPIVPLENDLNIEILAGVKKFHD